MFGSVNALVTAALIAERNSFLAEAFGSTGLPDPLAIADYEQFWRAMVWAVLDSGPIDLTELTSGGSVVQLRARLAQANPDAAASTIDGITAAWAVTPLGALVFRGPLQRGFTIDDADWDWSWRRLRRRLNALVGGGHVGEPAPPIGTSEPPATPANTASRLRLIDAAGELLATRLEQGVSGRELAEHAGVNYGLVNHYFGSKDAVFDEALQQMHRRFLLDILLDDLSQVRYLNLEERFTDGLVVQTFTISGVDERGAAFNVAAVDLYPIENGLITKKDTYWKHESTPQ